MELVVGDNCPICKRGVLESVKGSKELRCLCCEEGQSLPKGGTKNDREKNRLELLSAQWIEGVGNVLTFGAKKYAAHNWRKGLSQSRLLGAALRHLFAYLRGEDLDPESGLSHLLHASCCLMFAFELKETHPELDDRYKSDQGPPPDQL